MSKFILKYVFFLTVFISCFLSVYSESMSFETKFGYNSKSGTTLLAFSKKMSGINYVQRYDTVSSLSRKQAADTIQTKINKIFPVGNDVYRVEIDLAQDQQNLTIAAYNLLGKKVLDIHQGGDKAGEKKTYDMNTTSIPSGIYICVVQGDNFRFAEKFYLSK
ncbi:MAG: T9SS type A sorting domain-containing protein [Ignavibacteriae bacterium]|nr:T9SS type A sorting domain-containing protein [Ignavibacteriota bacterium]